MQLPWHFLIGFMVYILLEWLGVFPHSTVLLTVFVVGNIIVDVEHIFFLPVLGRGSMEWEIWRAIRRRDTKKLSYIVSNHKMLAGSPTHSLLGWVYTPLLLGVSATIYGWEAPTTLLLAGILTHLAVDLIDDIIVVGSPKNWVYLPSKLLSRKRGRNKSGWEARSPT